MVPHAAGGRAERRGRVLEEGLGLRCSVGVTAAAVLVVVVAAEAAGAAAGVIERARFLSRLRISAAMLGP